MIRLRPEITTNRVSIGSTSVEFSILQRILTDYGADTDPFSRDTGDFSGNITACEKSDCYYSLVFRLGRIVLVPLLPQNPSVCRRDFTVTSQIPEVELTISVFFVDMIA